MDGVVEATNSLRNVHYLGIRIDRVWLIQACAEGSGHVLFVSKDQDGNWRLSLVCKLPEPAIVRKIVTADEEQAIRIAGLITSANDPAGFYDMIAVSKSQDESHLVPAELCERVYRAMGTAAHAA